jgi:F0F1-type ATP synthase membrane subunit b/b'
MIMAENLIDQIRRIEEEADAIVRSGHEDAERFDAEADQHIGQLEAELDEKYRQQAKAVESRLDTERQHEEEELRERSKRALERIRGFNVKEATALIDRIVGRIINS